MRFEYGYARDLVEDFAENCDAVDKKHYRAILRTTASLEKMAEYVKDFYNEKHIVTKEDEEGNEVKETQRPHAKDITDCRTNTRIVNDYYKAYLTAIEGAANDESEDYRAIHFGMVEALENYFIQAYVSVIAEEFGEDFIEFYSNRIDLEEAEKHYTEAKKKVSSAKQSVARLKKPKNGNVDAAKVKEAETKLAAAEEESKKAEEAYNALKKKIEGEEK